METQQTPLAANDNASEYTKEYVANTIPAPAEESPQNNDVAPPAGSGNNVQMEPVNLDIEDSFAIVDKLLEDSVCSAVEDICLNKETRKNRVLSTSTISPSSFLTPITNEEPQATPDADHEKAEDGNSCVESAKKPTDSVQVPDSGNSVQSEEVPQRNDEKTICRNIVHSLRKVSFWIQIIGSL